MDAASDYRLADDRRRPVAFVGDRDQLILQSDGTHDLGGRREEGRDAHGSGRSPGRHQPEGLSSSTEARAAALSVYQVASITV